MSDSRSPLELEAGAKAAFELGLTLVDSANAGEIYGAYQDSIDLGRLSGTKEGLETGAQAAFNLAILSIESHDTKNAVQAYLDALELGRLSETKVGLEAGAAAAFNLGLLLEDGGDADKAARAYEYGVELGRASGSEGGREADAKAAFGLRLSLGRVHNVSSFASTHTENPQLSAPSCNSVSNPILSARWNRLVAETSPGRAESAYRRVI